MVYQIAYSVLNNAADAEEVTQEVFLRAYRKLGSLREPQKFRGWVARMSWRMALNHNRSATRAQFRDTAWMQQTHQAAPQPSVEALAAAREFESRLRQAIARLPEKLRVVVTLHAIQGVDLRDVASILEIPEGTVRSRLHLARKQLLEELS